MDPDRINVFHGAYHDGIIMGITHNFIFDLFETRDTALNEALVHRAHFQPGISYTAELLPIMRKTAASAAQRICRPHNHGIPEFIGIFLCIFYSMDYIAFRDRLPQFVHQ